MLVKVFTCKKQVCIQISKLIEKKIQLFIYLVSNDIRCPNCVKIAMKIKWNQEHEKTIAEKTIEKNKDKYYDLKARHEPIRK